MLHLVCDLLLLAILMPQAGICADEVRSRGCVNHPLVCAAFAKLFAIVRDLVVRYQSNWNRGRPVGARTFRRRNGRTGSGSDSGIRSFAIIPQKRLHAILHCPKSRREHMWHLFLSQGPRSERAYHE
ncbi:hypothetical protein DAEQUDRAFT_215519 [Daedalea quercina L-15889]|uniref:Secreted protein n=1 Tax=Daedalea quercina L-15889 TaxID=1314783 RepID=A0A165R3Y0_9APHY|nr:hypothetical protein DAEQUDRAFT_215519 [Daedalea quercina L-15889]